ncbi:MAG: hypothetical protein MJ249_05750 [Kiritimatiellae bacterium]|nr:hypothetical protein [Kiritimatiellia bacterium]
MNRVRDAWLDRTVPVVRERYARHEQRCREKLMRGERLRVCFLVCDVAMFSGESVYRKMCTDDRYDPFIAVVPRVSRGEAFLRETLEKTCAQLSARYGKVECLYDVETHKKTPLTSRVDIVCTSIVYDDQTFPDYTTLPLSKTSLVVCFPYGYGGPLRMDARQFVFLPQIAFFWKIFTPNEFTHNVWAQANPRLRDSLVVAGYSKMDRLEEVSIKKERPKTVIISSHHTLARGPDCTALSNFLRYADFFLELPKRYPHVHFVFRPHPLLFPRLATSKWWGGARTNAYRQQLMAFSNVEFQQGGDYFETFVNSDAMIHDCGSFLAEYYYTGKPQCYLLENEAALEREFTDFGQQLIAHAYSAYTQSEIIDFIEKVVLGEQDERAQTRRTFAENQVCRFYPKASEHVLDIFSAAFKEEASN